MARRRMLALLTLSWVVAACAGLASLAPVDLPPNLEDQLECWGEGFTPSLPPPGVVDGAAVVNRLRAEGFPPFAPPNAHPAPPIYGVISERGPGTCRDGGFVPAGQELQVWLVLWPGVSGAAGGSAWAIVDARTGSFLVGDGPPGG